MKRSLFIHLCLILCFSKLCLADTTNQPAITIHLLDAKKAQMAKSPLVAKKRANFVPTAKTISPAAPVVPTLNTRIDHFRQISGRILIYDYSGAPRLIQTQFAIAISPHFWLTPSAQLQGAITSNNIRFFVQNDKGNSVETRIRDLDLRQGVATLYAASENRDFIKLQDLSTDSWNRRKENLPWTMTNLDSDFSAQVWLNPENVIANNWNPWYPIQPIQNAHLQREGSLLLTKSLSIAGLELSPQMIQGSASALMTYLPAEALAQKINSTATLPDGLPNYRAAGESFSRNVEFLQNFYRDQVNQGSVIEISTQHWRLDGVTVPFQCRGDHQRQLQCESKAPVNWPNQNPLIESKLKLEELDSGNEDSLQHQLAKAASFLQEKFGPEPHCYQRRLNLSHHDSQFQVCAGPSKSLPQWTSDSVIRGVLLDSKHPLYFELYLRGFSGEQAGLMSTQFLTNLQERTDVRNE